jgi:hypothetical protein
MTIQMPLGHFLKLIVCHVLPFHVLQLNAHISMLNDPIPYPLERLLDSPEVWYKTTSYSQMCNYGE